MVLVITIIILLFKFFKTKKLTIAQRQGIILLNKKNIELLEKVKASEQSDNTKLNYLTDISHQIRTCSNAIVGFTEFVAENNTPNTNNGNFLQIIKQNNDLLLKTIDDILDISLIEQGKLKIGKEPVSLNHLLEETYLFFNENPRLLKNHIDFTYYLDNKRNDLVITSDTFRLKQILILLIDNSINFTESGQISFTYKVIQQSDKDFVCFRVDDSGIGIAPDYQQKIFERFFRIQGNNNDKRHSLGLGLSIAKSLITQMGGDIWVNSEPNIGSTFFFTIPIEPN